MTEADRNRPADLIQAGTEDRFFYTISDACVMCGACQSACPTGAITAGEESYEISPAACIDCGTCSAVCPVGAAQPVPGLRESISARDLAESRCYFNPGCAIYLYRPELPDRMLDLLRRNLDSRIGLHTTCCRHNPQLEEGAILINNCAGCDRRFRSLYRGVRTISYWEVLDSLPRLDLPDRTGLTVSVHDSCGYRHKPQVHRAVRNLLRRMHVELRESPFSGTRSVCCGDNFYGLVPNEEVERRIQMRAGQLPCQDVVVSCIGCARAMTQAGKRAHYLPDLLFSQDAEPILDCLDAYHAKLADHIARHSDGQRGL